MKKFLPLLLIAIFWSCGNKKTKAPEDYKLSQPLTQMAPYDEGVPLTDKPVDAEAPYKMDDYVKYYSEYYKDKKTPPPFDFNVDLSNKSFQELRLLRAEILARHGYLFMDYVLRSHFNATNWYKPVFWDSNFQIQLTAQEKAFIDKVLAQEKKLYSQNYSNAEGQKIANLNNLVNHAQFESIPAEMTEHLQRDGFVINKGNYEQLFHVYDENYYDYTPSFITTDLYLQVLHMHISKEMQALEEEKMYPLMKALLEEQYNFHKQQAQSATARAVKEASAWNQTYYAIGLSLLLDKKFDVPATFAKEYDYEMEHTTEASGKKSNFLGDSLIDYTQFNPRGNYTRNDTLKSYFRCIKWLNSAFIFLDEDETLARAITMGAALLKNPESLKLYGQYANIVNFLAGDENNLSFQHLFLLINKNESAETLLAPQRMEKIRAGLYARDPRRFKPKGINEPTEAFLARKKLLFTAGRYTFDAEILQRLTHVTEPAPKRPFPKGLDVFAAMGNKTAEDILLNEYKENEKWEVYSDTLNLLKSKFSGFGEWNKSVYNKKMETVLSLQKPNKDYPYFMQLPNWQRKNLNTMLASWTELKHDMILYIEQPSAAEMGDGGEIPPPQKIAYVEPQVEFWKKCKEILSLNQKMLKDNNLLSDKLKERNDKLMEMADFLLKISEKELRKQNLSAEEFDQLSFLGGNIESLTLNILESTVSFVNMVSTPDRYISVVADVYTYRDQCLEEGVGLGDEIYVVAEINGLLYLTRGAVFSQYEFVQPSESRLTDEEWQKQVLDNKEPPHASWMNAIKIKVPKLNTAPNFNLY